MTATDDATRNRDGAPFPVYGVVRINVARFGNERPDELSRTVQQIADAPFGARVELVVAPGQLYPASAIEYVRQHARHIDSVVVFCSDPATCARWRAALREGAVSWTC